MDLQKCRAEIDAVDRELLHLFERRMELSAQVADYKRAHGLPVLDRSRECEKLEAVGSTLPEELKPYGERLFETLFALSRDRQERLLAERDAKNLVLIGMPGSGKTTLSRILAARTGREVFDCDDLVCEAAGMTIPEIFERLGESAFRDLETASLRELGERTGCIIATGGGCVLREENYPLLHKNGRIVWIRRSLEALATVGRPLSTRLDLHEMYDARKALYERFADASIENDATLEEAADRIWAQF